MNFSEEQIESLAPNPAAFKAGKKLSASANWETKGINERVMWGTIKGSGKNPYYAQVDIQNLAYKCSCPSRQFPCKHAVGLMLLQTNEPAALVDKEEPEWVSDWINKRQVRQEKEANKEVLEKTPEEEEKSQKNKQKTQDKRIESVKAGVAELQLWLSDLVRLGILELPLKKQSEFKKVQARMIDAKAPGLAGWIRSLSKIDYSDPHKWQDEAMKIIAKLHLLLSAFQNLDEYDETWQITIKNLVGWSQSTKELLADLEALKIKDKWLLLGQKEDQNDDITTQRTWLYGLDSKKKALILQFSTPFSSYETILVPGTVARCELAFFPSIQTYRSVVSLQNRVVNELPPCEISFESIADTVQDHKNLVTENPWNNEQISLLENVRLVSQNEQWFIIDNHKSMLPIDPLFDTDKCLQFLLVSGNEASNLAIVYTNDFAWPLGIFHDQNYILL